MFKQVSFATHQKYNHKIEKLLSLGLRVYVVSVMEPGPIIKYKVYTDLMYVIIASLDSDLINIVQFKLGQTKPKSYWGKVELETMKSLSSDKLED